MPKESDKSKAISLRISPSTRVNLDRLCVLLTVERGESVNKTEAADLAIAEAMSRREGAKR